jgi:hypothetical protein
MLVDATTERATQPPAQAARVRAHVRQAEQAARQLIARAAHMEKRAARPRTAVTERMRLDANARELRAAADALLAEISELSRQARKPDLMEAA